MAEKQSSGQARLCLQQYELIKARLSAAALQQRQQKEAVVRAVEDMRITQAIAVLREIPIEELNQGKQGFRIKTLRRYGCKSIAQLYAADAAALESIPGIGKESAQAMLREAHNIAQQVKKSEKIRLTLDHQTKEASALVLAVCKYRSGAETAAFCQKLCNSWLPQLEKEALILRPAVGFFSRLFVSKEKKQQAEQAYTALCAKLQSETGQNAVKAIRFLERVRQLDAEAAWQDFAKNAAVYFQIIEAVQPDSLGAQNSRFGLPEELALAVQKQPLDTTGLRCKLRHYQEWGVKYILHQKRVLLGDEMGLGKTVQAIAAMVALKNQGAAHFLVICPASVMTNWCREIQKHSAIPVVKIHGADKQQAIESWMQKGGTAVTTYETADSLTPQQDFVLDMLVVDEAHYVKNPKAKRTAQVKDISTYARYILFMTGTALENRVEEMIALIALLQPDIAQKLKKMEALSAAPRFQETAAPVYYRRRRQDVLGELPELIEKIAWCDLLPAEKVCYERSVLEKHFMEARRVSWNVPLGEASSKAACLQQIVKDAAAEGRKVIVFSFFLDTLQRVTDLLGDCCLAPIYGGVSPQKRQQLVDAFEQAPAGAVLPAQIQSGGTGLNIQAASVVVICEPQLKPSVENQAISRAYRMGQTRNVLVYRLLCTDTVDERIIQLLQEKQQQFDAFADQSAVAKESMALDEKAFHVMMAQEAIRIRNKKQAEKKSAVVLPPQTE